KFVVSLTDATQEYVTGSSVHPDRFSMATSRVTHPSGAVDLGTTVTVIGKPSSWVAWGGGPLEGSSVVDSGPASPPAPASPPPPAGATPPSSAAASSCPWTARRAQVSGP